MNKRNWRWMYAQPQVVGKNWDMAYYSDQEMFATRRSAWKHGCRTLHHDDFLVVAVENNKLVDVQFGPDGDEREKDVEEWDGITREFCLDE